MIGSHSNTARVNLNLPFARLPAGCRTRKRLRTWAGNAVKAFKPWVMEITERLDRTWERNPNFDQGQHSKKRWEIERQLAADLETWERRRHYIVFNHVPGLVRFRAKGVLGPLRHVLAAGDWWKPRADVDECTGEVKETLYLPEDTRSAAGLVHWCITKMESFYGQAVARRKTTTPPSKPRGATTPPAQAQLAFTDSEERSAFFDVLRKLSRAGPDPPAMR